MSESNLEKKWRLEHIPAILRPPSWCPHVSVLELEQLDCQSGGKSIEASVTRIAEDCVAMT